MRLFSVMALFLCALPLMARFLEVDPKREFFNSYNYAGNNPMVLIDPNGKHVTISRMVRPGRKDLVTIHMTAKLVDDTTWSDRWQGFSEIKMEEYKQRIITQFEKSYTGVGQKIEFQGKLDLTVARPGNPITKDDHVFRIVEHAKLQKTSDPDVATMGLAGKGHKVVFLSHAILAHEPAAVGKYQDTGFSEQGFYTLERTSAHEAGHTMGLEHPGDMSMMDLMHQTATPMAGEKISEAQVEQMERDHNAGKLNQPAQDVDLSKYRNQN